MAIHFRFTRRITLVAMLAAAFLTGQARASNEMTRFEIDFFQNGSSEPMNQATIWISARRVRIEQRRSNAIEKGPVLVYRGDKDQVLSISDRDREYSQIDRRMLRLLGMRSPGARSRTMKSAVDAQLKGLPGDQRVALERVLGISREDAVASPLIVAHETERSSVAGIDCTRVVMTRAEKPVGDACVASWDQVGLKQADIEVFRALANFQRDALGARGVTPVEFVPDQTFDLIVQFDGFPLSFRRIVDDDERSAIRVRSIEHGPPDDALFSAPSGYARRAGYSAFLKHLSSSGSGSGSKSTALDSTKDATSRSAKPTQPTASPAPTKRGSALLRREPPRRYHSISLFPRDS